MLDEIKRGEDGCPKTKRDVEQCSNGFLGLRPQNMAQSATLTPNLSVLLPLFRERCACIQQVVKASHHGITGEIIIELRASQLVPLPSPTKAQLAEELCMIASLSVTIDLVTQGWLITATEPEVTIEFTNGVSPEAESRVQGSIAC